MKHAVFQHVLPFFTTPMTATTRAMLHHSLQPDIISHSTSIPWLPWTAATAAPRRIGHVALRPNVVTFGCSAWMS
jgi:hypothetical protein